MMNDKVKPFGLDFTKDLHGHVRIETRDRWTGRVVDSQEKDNLITNAISKAYQISRGAYANLWSYFAPIYAKALGGILLFDDTLTASADNYMFPGSAKLCGFAGQVANTSNPMGGSLNTSESVEGSNFYTTVWDFGTSQVNGTIASLARTSYGFVNYVVGGMSGIFNDTYMGPYTWGSVLVPIGYDPTNKYLYVTVYSSQTYNGVTYSTNKIYRTPCDLGSLGLFDFYLVNWPNKWTELITVSSSTDGTSTAAEYFYDPHSDNFVYVSGTKLYQISTSGTRSSITLPASASLNTTVATANYYWTMSGNKIYQINKSNPVDTASVTLDFTPSRMVALGDDCVIVSGAYTGSDYVVVYSDMSTVYFNAFQNVDNNSVLTGRYNYSPQKAPLCFDTFFACASAGPSRAFTPYINTSYLGTIANLDSPVTKTSSQTMKITYTLTEA